MTFLFVCTCTINFKRLVREGVIHFSFTEKPSWSSLLTVSDIKLHNSIYMTQKVGHFSGFFILSLILTNLGTKGKGIVWAIAYAVLTEILQLFFNRDGRIVDMFIDAVGILFAYALCRLIRKANLINTEIQGK